MILEERINRLKKIFNKPYYFLTRTQNREIIIRFEDEDGLFFEFKDSSISGTVREAENYASHEIAAGTLKEDETQTTEANDERQLKMPF